MEKKNRKCIVKNYFYNIYYYGKDSYGSDFSKVKFFNFKEIPDYIKNDLRNEIIFLDTEKGLELLVGEFEKLKKLLLEKDNSN